MEIPPTHYARTGDGVTIAYTVFGEGPALLISGVLQFPDVQTELRYPPAQACYESLARERTVVLFNPRGQGGSDRHVEDLSLDAYISDAEAVLLHAGIDRVDLFASYRWTPVAIEWAARPGNPIQRLILWLPYTSGSALLEEPVPTAILPTVEQDFATYLRVGIGVAGVPAADTEPLLEIFRQGVDEEEYPRVLEAVSSWDVGDRLSEIEAPTPSSWPTAPYALTRCSVVGPAGFEPATERL